MAVNIYTAAAFSGQEFLRRFSNLPSIDVIWYPFQLRFKARALRNDDRAAVVLALKI
jgi:hypothetical protein